MSWRDRDYGSGDDSRYAGDGSAWGRPGGDWAGMRPTIDNPFTWSLPLARISGITVRMHLFFLVFIIVQLAQGALPTEGVTVNFTLMAMSMALLFVIVLAHELGHCVACRLVGGEADEILMWPLGGLASTQPPHNWRADLITTLGGPMVNLAICVLAGSMLWLITRTHPDCWSYVIPNPLKIDEGLIGSPLSRSFAHQALYLTNAISLVLLLFNLMPVFPLDGGRALQQLLWPRVGYSRSMRYAVRVGYVGALALCVFGMVSNQWSIVIVAIFGAVACHATQRQLDFSDAMLADDDEPEDEESDAYAMSVHAGEDEGEPQQHRAVARPSRSEQAEQRRADVERREAAEIDRILLKISQQGMASLTPGERGALQQATDRKRKASEQ